MYDDLLDLLQSLDGVRQNPRFHPEGDALYHSLQVFDQARRDTDDRALWAAALLHDVGKAIDGPRHAEVGAELLDDLLSPRITWLVCHHLDLMRHPAATRRKLRATSALADLTRLRRWDLAGRSPTATVLSPQRALEILLDGADLPLLLPGGEPAPTHATRKEIA